MIFHCIVFPLTEGRDFALLVIIVPVLSKVHFTPNTLISIYLINNNNNKTNTFPMIQSQHTYTKYEELYIKSHKIYIISHQLSTMGKTEAF